MSVRFDDLKRKLIQGDDQVYYLMNRDIEVLRINLRKHSIKVLYNDLLPYSLKDYIVDTDNLDIEDRLNQIDWLRNWLSGRVLSLSRENAKAILNSACLPQSMRTSDRIKIVLACRGLSVLDNFWIKSIDEDILFESVNLRKVPLKDSLVDISLNGKCISITAEELRNDITTNGMFAKAWRREDDVLKLYKSDATLNYINTKAEVECSKILDQLNIRHVKYQLQTLKSRVCAVSDCFTSDSNSFVSALEIKDWCRHLGIDWKDFLLQDAFRIDIANMCVIDYVLANTDRHLENWGFMVDCDNKLLQLAPLYDFNQALIADEFDTVVDDLKYDVLGLEMLPTAIKAKKYATVDFGRVELPKRCKERWEKLEYCKGDEVRC